MARSRVRVIEPEPWETDEGHKLSGRANLALKSESGNTEKNEIDFDYKLDYRRRWHRFESAGQLEYDTNRGIKSTEKWSMRTKYSRLFRGPCYAAGWLLLNHDRFADQKLRTGLLPTLGYRFFEGAERNLRVELGPGYLNENFYDGSDRGYWGPFWHLDYDQLVWKGRLQLYHEHQSFWAADDADKQIWKSWTGVRVPLIAGFIGSVESRSNTTAIPRWRPRRLTRRCG